MAPSGRRVVITGICEPLGRWSWRGAGARSRHLLSGRHRHRRPRGRPGADRVHRGRHPQPGHLPDPARARARRRRPLRDRLVPGARQAGAGAARHQRDRDPAAARRLREVRRAARLSSPGGRRRSTAPRARRRRFFTEEMARRYPLKTRFQRDIGELESYFDNFARRHPDITCTMLRFQPEIGPGLDQPLARYLTLPVVPTQLGFDPRLQLVHADDATGALAAAVAPAGPRRGQRRSRRDDLADADPAAWRGRPTVPIPHPIAATVLGRLGRQLGAADLYNDGIGCCATDAAATTPASRRRSASCPRFDAEGAVRDFIAKEAGRAAAVPGAASALARRLDRGPPDRDATETVGEATDFMRRLRSGLDDGAGPARGGRTGREWRCRRRCGTRWRG